MWQSLVIWERTWREMFYFGLYYLFLFFFFFVIHGVIYVCCCTAARCSVILTNFDHKFHCIWCIFFTLRVPTKRRISAQSCTPRHSRPLGWGGLWPRGGGLAGFSEIPACRSNSECHDFSAKKPLCSMCIYIYIYIYPYLSLWCHLADVEQGVDT